MIVLGLIAALFTIFIAGLGVTMSILARGGRVNLIECVCLAWLLGTGVVSLLLWLCGMFCSGLILQTVVTIACLGLAILGWRAKKRSNATFALPRPSNVTEWILSGIVLIEIAVLLFVSFKHTLGWDGLLNWELKARYAFLNGGSIPSSYYSSAGRAFSHPEYPLGIPFTELWLYLWMGEPNQFWVKIIFPLFYAACAPLLALLVSRLSGKRWLSLLVAALLPFVPSISASPGGVVVGYVDVPLSVFYLAALGYLLCWFKTEGRQFIIVFAACSALLPWIKSEGIILWAVLVALGFILGLSKHRLAQFLVSITPGLLLVLCWKIYLKLVHLWPHSDFVTQSLNWLRDNFGRLRDIFRILFEEVSEPVHWSIFWLLAAVAVVYLFTSRKLEKVILAGAVVLPVILYSLIYLFSSWPSYTAHMTSSVPRLLLHVMPAGWLAIGLALSQAKSENRTL
jgi:hypothetical protein